MVLPFIHPTPLAYGFLNGALDAATAQRFQAQYASDNLVLAADGGLCHALALGITPQWVIGDMDSAPAALQKQAHAQGAQFTCYPRYKDQTDAELLLHKAQALGVKTLLLLAATGGRIDMTLSHFALLAQPCWQDMTIALWQGEQTIWFMRPAGGALQGWPGDTVSLLAWGGAVQGLSTQGLRWVLQHETLETHSVRATSNVLLQRHASIAFTKGLLLVTHTPHQQVV